MIYTAPCVFFFMRADTLRGEVGGGRALETESFLGPVKWHRADRRVPYGAQKTRDTISFLLQGSYMHVTPLESESYGISSLCLLPARPG
jgi:hypothetical protein